MTPEEDRALFVRLPARAAEKLERAAFARKLSKKDLVYRLVDQHLEPLQRRGGADRRRAALVPARGRGADARGAARSCCGSTRRRSRRWPTGASCRAASSATSGGSRARPCSPGSPRGRTHGVRPLVLYDADCNFCATVAAALASWDRARRLRFATIQGPLGEELPGRPRRRPSASRLPLRRRPRAPPLGRRRAAGAVRRAAGGRAARRRAFASPRPDRPGLPVGRRPPVGHLALGAVARRSGGGARSCARVEARLERGAAAGGGADAAAREATSARRPPAPPPSPSRAVAGADGHASPPRARRAPAAPTRPGRSSGPWAGTPGRAATTSRPAPSRPGRRPTAPAGASTTATRGHVDHPRAHDRAAPVGLVVGVGPHPVARARVEVRGVRAVGQVDDRPPGAPLDVARPQRSPPECWE